MASITKQLRRWLTIGLLTSHLSFSTLGHAAAQDSFFPSPVPPTNAQLDALLEARDWGRLSAALYPPPGDPASFQRILDWLQARLARGAGFLVAFSYMRYLWIAGSSLQVNDPLKDVRITAGMFGLYAFELAVIDGAKCEDKSAPSRRVDQLLWQNPTLFAFLKSQPTEMKEKLVATAIEYEKRTAPVRRDDDLLCRGGLDEMRAGLERGSQQEVPNRQGYVGRTVEVTPPPDWTPRFLPQETYVRTQIEARGKMRENLLKLIQ